MDLLTLLGGAFLLSLLHGLIPNHWLPFLLLGRDRDWSPRQIVFVTFLGGTAHLSSTVLVGVMIGIAGIALSNQYEAVMRWAGPAILIGAGLWVMTRRRACHHGHAHGEPYSHTDVCQHDLPEKHAEHAHKRLAGSDLTALGALCAMMFLSPCVELDTYYVIAYRRGWLGIAAVSLVYLVVTVSVMMLLVGLSARGMGLLRWPFFERHERRISGGLLILLGAAWILFPL